MKILTWDDIPWPTFVELTRPEELKQEVKAYLEFLGEFEYRISQTKGESLIPIYDPYMQQNPKGAANFFAEYMARWHPDRLEVRVFDRVVERDKEKVRTYANKVVGILYDIQDKANGSEGM
jgi:hypothetical protein